MGERRPGPRPAVVGTCTLAPFEVPGGDEQRLADGLALVDAMAAVAKAKGWQLDLVVCPEHFSQGRADVPRAELAEPIEGRTVTAMAEKARKHGTYAAVPLLLSEGEVLSNAVVLLDRDGQPVGTYRKVHPVLLLDGTLEGGISPGREYPVFDLDFGRVGVQICFDVFFRDGWQALDDGGAELVVFTSATSAVASLRAYACLHEYYVLASTFRPPTIFVNPLGYEVGRTSADKEVLVRQVDLDYRVVPWNSLRDFGQALGEKYGERVRQGWSGQDDMCLLTSNDPELPVAELMKIEAMETNREHLARNIVALDKARGGPPAR
jgi:predicted amidohydrolase